MRDIVKYLSVRRRAFDISRYSNDIIFQGQSRLVSETSRSMEASDVEITMGNADEIDEVDVEAKEYEKSEMKMELYEKRLGAADTAGQDYELGICVLLFLRGLRHCHDFHMASNHDKAGDFDDAVFVYRDVGHDHYNAILVQLKHKRSAQITYKSLIAQRHDFSIPKYLRSFEKCHEFWRTFNIAGRVCPLKEVSYVLYTNATAVPNLNLQVVDPSFARLLCTSGKFVRLRLEDIPDAFSDSSNTNSDKLRSQKFLKRFVLSHSQGGHQDVETYVSEEIRHLLRCGDDDIIGVKEKLMSGFKSWWAENKRQVEYVNKHFPIWRDILRSRVERFGEPYDSKEMRIDLCYSDSCLDKVKSLIHGTKQLALVVVDQHEARLAYSKVKNAVKSDFLPVSADIFMTNSEEIVQLSHLRAFKTLVVIALNGLNNEYDESLRSIARKVAGGVVLICHEATEFWNTESISTVFSDLEVTSADQILEREINLQGTKFRLRDLTTDVTELTSKLNASHLIELSSDYINFVRIGQVLNDPIPYFVSRRLTRHKLLEKSFFSGLKENDEMCIIVGELDVLRHLRLRRGFSQESYGTMSPQTYKSDCIHMLPDEEANKVFHIHGDNAKFRSVHLVKYDDGNFFWLKSHGDKTTVLKHVVTEEITNIFYTKDTAIIISGKAGSGKSTWMEYVAANKNENPTWVLKFDVTEKSMMETNFDNLENVKNFLVERCSSSDRRPGALEDILLRHALDVVGNVVILVDNLDELNTRNVEKFFQLLSILPKVKHSKLVVAMKLSLKDRVEKVLETYAYDLEPFVDKEKRQFLRNFWRFKGIDYGADETAKVEAVVENSGDCLSNPLMAYVTAQMTLLNSMEPGDHLNLKPTPQLYTKLLEMELNNLWVQKVGIKENSPSDGEVFQLYKEVLFKELMKLAATIFLPEDQLKERKFEISSEKLLNSGLCLIVCKDQDVNFVHRSFAEYFFAMWLKSNDSDGALLKENLFKSNVDFVRQCFSSFYIEQHDLHAAVAEEDVERVRSLLSQKDETDAAGRTALHVAAMNASKNYRTIRTIAQLLIDAGVSTDAEDSLMKCDALRFALAARNWDVADLLLATKHYKDSKSALKLVGRFENSKDMFRKFCRRGYAELVRCMVKLDNDLLMETYGYGKDSVLHLAAESGSTDLVKWLLKQRGVKVSVNNDGLTPASVAAREGHVDILKIFRDDVVSQDRTVTACPLHEAALKNHVDALNYIIGLGVDVDAEDSSGETALHYAAREGHLEIVRHLLVVGKVNSASGSLETPLHCAALRGRAAVVEALLDAGADENARNSAHETPLHSAANRGESGVVDMLVSRGADMTARDAKGRAPLHCAARYKHLAVVNTLIRAGASVNARDGDMATPLHHAAWEGNSKNDAFLLRRLWSGEKVRPDEAYQAPSHTILPPGTAEIVSALLGAGADVNAVDNQQLTPATYSRDEAVRQMLQGDGAVEDLTRFSLTRLPGCRSGVVI